MTEQKPVNGQKVLNDRGTPVSDDYEPSGSDFNGQGKCIQIDLGDDAKDADHFIWPEERYRIALAP